MTDEVVRRLVHALGAVVPLSWAVGPVRWEQLQAAFVVGAGLALVLEALRLVVGVDWAIYEKLTREYEQDNLAGYALYVISSAVTVVVFRPEIAVPAILMLMLADPVSGLLGSGELRTVKRPGVLGAMFLLCLAIALAWLPPIAAGPAALAATLADGVKPRVATYVIDDNLTIPLFASVAAWTALAIV